MCIRPTTRAERERANGGQIQVPDALEIRNTELYIRMDSAFFIVFPGLEFAPH